MYKFNLLIALALLCFLESCDKMPQATKPNIIFIMADDLGYGDLESYGQKEIKTPNLNKLARQGIQFSDCYAGSPVCAPSRSVLMTGRHTGHTTIRGNFGQGGVVGLGGGEGRVPLNAGDVTIAEVLKQAGYATAITGKWGLGEPNTSGLPNDQGFDEWFGFLNQRRAHHHYTDYIWKNKVKYKIAAEDKFKEENYTHNLFTQFSLDFIRSRANQDYPFFLYIPYLLPHDEYEIPAIHKAYQNRGWTEEEQVHASMVSLIDSDVGKIISLLEELEIRDNTLVFFTSDNGAAQRWDGRFDSSGSLRGRKRDVYEGGIRVPMIVSMPGTVPEGVTNSTPWYFPDVFPTLADFAETGIPGGLDGISLKNIISQNESGDPERLLYWEFHEKGGKQAIRKGKWKLVRLNVDEKGFHQDIELYNLELDPGESDDVADQNPVIVKEMVELMDAQRVKSENFLFSFENQPDPGHEFP